jgi:hypothetical protein
MNPSRNQKNPETGGKKKTAAHPISFFRAWKYQRRTSPLNQNPSFQIAAPREPPNKFNFLKYAPFLAKESGIKPWDILAVVAQTGNSTKESKKEIDGKNKTQTISTHSQTKTHTHTHTHTESIIETQNTRTTTKHGIGTLLPQRNTSSKSLAHKSILKTKDKQNGTPVNHPKP